MKRKYGFNMQWMFSYEGQPAQKADLKQLDFIAKRAFNFIRVPLDYNFWTKDFDYTHPDERVLDEIDGYLEACNARGLHMCLNLHRAPGYCRNYNCRERDNLWTDQAAQDGFVFLWEYFARKYKGVPSEKLSFNLLNEPPVLGTYAFTRENHQAVMRRTVAAIRKVDPEREIVLDGINGGSGATPELADEDVIFSGRGYDPFFVSHYRAEWLDFPVDWPQKIDYPCMQNGQFWDKARIVEAYRPWRDMEAAGAKIHIGEFGCYNKTPNDVAHKWLADLLDIFYQFRWGYALWNFEGAYGIVNHKKEGAVYENVDGFMVDRVLLDMLTEHRIWD